MNYSEIFHFMRPELTLIVTIALLFLFDLFAPERLRRYFHPLACVLLTVQILVNIVPTPDSGQLFGGMYQYEPMQSIVKKHAGYRHVCRLPAIERMATARGHRP